MIDKLMQGLADMKITVADMEGAERLFRFLAEAIKETRVQLEIQGYEPEVEKLVKDRKMIDAIKLYRNKTPGATLKESKEAVDKMADMLGVRVNGVWQLTNSNTPL